MSHSGDVMNDTDKTGTKDLVFYRFESFFNFIDIYF